MARPKVYTIKLTDDECSKLSQVIRNKSTCKTVLKRCQILRVLDIVRGTGLTHTQIAHSYAVCLSTVSNVIQLYNQKGIDSVVKYNISPNSSAALRKVDCRTEAKLPADQYRTDMRGGPSDFLRNDPVWSWNPPVGRETIRNVLKKQA